VVCVEGDMVQTRLLTGYHRLRTEMDSINILHLVIVGSIWLYSIRKFIHHYRSTEVTTILHIHEFLLLTVTCKCDILQVKKFYSIFLPDGVVFVDV
jgi:hypothetical protein